MKIGTKAKVVGKKRRADGFENHLVERITDLMESRGRGRGGRRKGTVDVPGWEDPLCEVSFFWVET